MLDELKPKILLIFFVSMRLEILYNLLTIETISKKTLPSKNKRKKSNLKHDRDMIL